MKISIVTVFPEIHETFLKASIIGKAQEKKLLTINTVRLSDFVSPKERIDEPTVGPGSGMILKPDVVQAAIEYCEEQWGAGIKIFFSPQGTLLNQRVLKKLASEITHQKPKISSTTQSHEQHSAHLILVCPRYEGMDQRVESYYADYVFSIGDYVLMGGDIPAQVLLEGLLRLVPGVVGKWESVEKESFSGPFLDHPEYGLPVEWKGSRVPEIIQSGNHAAIEEWRKDQACKKTVVNRFDWFSSSQPEKHDLERAFESIPKHYVALMHTQIKLKDGTVGTTSVTSIDLHDTARSCSTYGIKNFFMVSPLLDQQKIIGTFLNFWQSPEGKAYNESRYHAVSKVKPAHTFNEVIEYITSLEGVAPIVIGTSAKTHQHAKLIDYHNKKIVWGHKRPVLFIFGTGQGLEDALINTCDYLLTPVTGMTSYNHLSVRSAIAIILDRWLGLHPKLE